MVKFIYKFDQKRGLKMQWHKAKVSIFLQSGQSLEQNKFNQRRFLKREGEILKFKKWGEDEETNPMHKIKS